MAPAGPFTLLPSICAPSPLPARTHGEVGRVGEAPPTVLASGERVQQINHPWSQGSFSPVGQWPSALPHALESPPVVGRGRGVKKGTHGSESQPACASSCPDHLFSRVPSRAPALACALPSVWQTLTISLPNPGLLPLCPSQHGSASPSLGAPEG